MIPSTETECLCLNFSCAICKGDAKEKRSRLADLRDQEFTCHGCTQTTRPETESEETLTLLAARELVLLLAPQFLHGLLVQALKTLERQLQGTTKDGSQHA